MENNKFTEFYMKVAENKEKKEEFEKILNGKRMEEADEAQLRQLGELAKGMGIEISLEEAVEYFQSEKELDEEELDAVAGGKSRYHEFGDCNEGIGGVYVSIG